MKSLDFNQKIIAAHGYFVLGINQHVIATFMSVNQGRISEACTAVQDALLKPNEKRIEA